MRFFLWWVTFLVASLSGVQAEEGRMDGWAGLYAEMQFGFGYGVHSLDYHGLGRQLSVYDLGLKHEVPLGTLGLGYRTLVLPQVYLGGELAVRTGTIFGARVETYQPLPISTKLSFSADTLVTAAVQVGYSPTPNLLVYGEFGLAASDLQVSLSGSWQEDAVSTQLRGLAPGRYLALGASRQMKDGWFVGAEVQYFSFSAQQVLRSRQGAEPRFFAASAELTQLMIVFGRKF